MSVTRFTPAGAEWYIATLVLDMEHSAEPAENYRMDIATAAADGFIYLVEYDPDMVLGV